MLLTTALDRRSCSRVLLCSLVMLRAACAQSAPDAPPLDRAALRALVQRQGESVACVRGHSIGRWRRIGPGGEEFVGDSAMQFVFETRPLGRFRDHHERLLLEGGYPTDTGVMPNHVTSVTYGYDGRTTWTWRHFVHAEGKPDLRARAEGIVVTGRRHGLQSSAASCWSYTLPGFFAHRQMEFFEGLDAIDGGIDLDFVLDDAAGEVVVTRRLRRRPEIDRWFLSRPWRFCLRRHEKVDGASGQVVDWIEVRDATRLHPDFWYPTHVVSSVPWSGRRLESEWRLDAVAVAALDDAEFEPRFPADLPIWDEDTQSVLMPGSLMPGSAGTRGGAGMSSTYVRFERGSARSVWRMVVSVVLAMAGAVLLWGKRSRRGRRGSRRRERAKISRLSP